LAHWVVIRYSAPERKHGLSRLGSQPLWHEVHFAGFSSLPPPKETPIPRLGNSAHHELQSVSPCREPWHTTRLKLVRKDTHEPAPNTEAGYRGSRSNEAREWLMLERRLVNRPPTNHRLQHLHIRHILCGNRQRVTINDDEISKLADLQ
jgi:hypothetical protein